VEKGIRELIVDGKKIEGTIVPFEEGKKEYNVTAVMG
jgi:cellobiose phosphorylase